MFEPSLVSIAIPQPQMLLHEALAWIQNLGGVGGIIFVLLYVVATICLIPGSILTLGAGALFGVGWGSFYVLMGAIIGETCAFLLGRYLVRDWIDQKIAANKTFVALNRAINREGLKIILLTRLSPVFPFSLLNYAFGITGISLKDYFLGSVGMIPMTITYVYLGSFASELANISEASQLAHPQLQWGLKIFGSLATIVAALYLTQVARQALDKSLRESTIGNL
ncbi:MAG: TVP38/TMEM64 family protein [Cyanobacteria bacterium J06643_13]